MRNGGSTSGRRLLTTAAVIIIGAFAGGCTEPAQAASYYVCDCLEAADAQCLPGDDSADGRTPSSAWRSYDMARTAFSAIEAGDRIRFCRGGAFDAGTSGRWVNDACRVDRPCTITDYLPGWAGGDEMRPVIRQERPGGYGFAFENGGPARHEEGYVLENLDIRGLVDGGSARFGVFLYNDVDDVTIRNVHVEGFNVGVHVGSSNECAEDDAVCDGVNDRISLIDSSVMYNSEQGWLGGSSGSVIEGNYFEGNGTRAIFDHNIYVSSTVAETVGMRVVGNRSYRSAPQAAGECGGASLVVHGNHTDLAISGNTIWEDVGAAQEECWGIAVDPGYSSAEAFTDVIVSGNTVRNVGNVGIGVAACVACTIENNVVVSEQAFAVRAIAAPDRTAGDGDAEMTGVTVRSNSIYLAGDSDSSIGIVMSGEGTGHKVVSNAIHYAGAGNDFSCLNATLPTGAYDVIDYNVCHFPRAGSGAEWADGIGGTADRSLLRWNRQTGFDEHSRMADPGFHAPGAPDYDLRATAEDADLIGAGDPTESSLYDFFARLRGGFPDAGAYQQGNAVRSRQNDGLRPRQRRMRRLRDALTTCSCARARLRHDGDAGHAAEIVGSDGITAPPRPIARVRAQLRKCRALLRADRTS